MSSGSIRAGQADIELKIRDRSREGLAKAEANLRGFAATANRLGSRLSSIGRGTLTGGLATAGIGLALLQPLRLASTEAGRFHETLNRFNATFGELAASTRTFGVDFSRAVNRSENDVLTALASYQAFFRGLEFGNEDAARLAKTIAQLAEDFGSFNNLESSDANLRFIQALSGSSEAVDQFGINLKQAAIDQELLREGLSVTAKDATEQQKVLARLAIINKSLGRQGAIGDAVRTADQFVNSQRGVRAALQDVQIAIGSVTLTMRAQWNAAIIATLRTTRQWIDQNQNLVRTYSATAVGLTVGGAAIAAVGGTFLAVGSAMRLATFAATGLAIPVVAIGAAGATTGRIFSSLTRTLSLPFVVLGRSLGAALNGIGLIGSATLGAVAGVLGLTRAVYAFVAVIGIIPALVLGASAAVILMGLQGRSLGELKKIFADLGTNISELFVIVSLSIDVVSKLTRGFSDLAFWANSYFATIVKLRRLLLPLEQVKAIGLAIATAPVSPTTAVKLLAGVERDGKSIVKSTAANAKELGKAVGDNLRLGLDTLREKYGSTLRDVQDFAKEVKASLNFGEVKSRVSDLLAGVDAGPVGDKLRELDKIWDGITARINAASDAGKDFAGQDLVRDFETTLNQLQAANSNKKDPTKELESIRARGTFSGQNVGQILGSDQSTRTLTGLLVEAKKSTAAQNRIARLLERSPVLRFQ